MRLSSQITDEDVRTKEDVFGCDDALLIVYKIVRISDVRIAAGIDSFPESTHFEHTRSQRVRYRGLRAPLKARIPDRFV